MLVVTAISAENGPPLSGLGKEKHTLLENVPHEHAGSCSVQQPSTSHQKGCAEPWWDAGFHRVRGCVAVNRILGGVAVGALVCWRLDLSWYSRSGPEDGQARARGVGKPWLSAVTLKRRITICGADRPDLRPELPAAARGTGRHPQHHACSRTAGHEPVRLQHRACPSPHSLRQSLVRAHRQ